MRLGPDARAVSVSLDKAFAARSLRGSPQLYASDRVPPADLQRIRAFGTEGDDGPANGAITSEGIGDGCEEGIGQYVRLRYPSNLPTDDRYDFEWQDLQKTIDPFQKFDYNAI
jgi:hypothetical protein